MQPICSNYFNHLQPSKIACKNMILLHSESWRNSNSAQNTVELHVQAALHNSICNVSFIIKRKVGGCCRVQ